MSWRPRGTSQDPSRPVDGSIQLWEVSQVQVSPGKLDVGLVLVSERLGEHVRLEDVVLIDKMPSHQVQIPRSTKADGWDCPIQECDIRLHPFRTIYHLFGHQ